MNKRCVLSIASMLLLVTPAVGMAETAAGNLETPYIRGALRKGSRGVANVFTAPLELVRQYRIQKQHHGFIRSNTVGVAHGVLWMVTRVGVGLFEVATFPFPFNGFDPLLEPEFISLDDDWLAGGLQPQRR